MTYQINHSQGLDKDVLLKSVRAIQFISNHIRHSGEIELANRLDVASYDLLDSAFKSETSFEKFKLLLITLLSLAKDKEYIKDEVVQKLLEVMSKVFIKRQDLVLEEVSILSIKDDVTDKLPEPETSHLKIELKKDERLSPIKDTKKDTAVTSNLRKIIFEDKRQSSRRSEILANLSGTPVSIKDISMNVLGCSEKTIQRELNALVDEGVIKRIGEKRWSKYILK